MKIDVKPMSGSTITIEIDASDTIGNVKAKIQDKEGIPLYQMVLMLCGKTLEDDYIVSDHILKNNTIVSLVLREKPLKRTILIKAPSSQTIPLEIESSDTIREVKITLKATTRFESHQMTLTCAGNIMKDSYIVFDHITQNNDPVYFVLQVKLKIKIWNLSSKYTSVTIYSSDTIGNVKIKLRDKIGIEPDQMTLAHGGKIMHDDYIVFDHIVNYERFVLQLRVKPPKMKIWIKTLSGKTIPLEIESFNTIGTVKAKIQDKEGIPLNRMMLTMRSETLEDYFSVADYIFENNATVYLVLRAKPHKMTILIKTPSGKITPHEIESSDMFGKVKAKIQDKEGIPLHQMVLMLCGKTLEDDYIVEDYIFENNTTIHLAYQAEPHKITISVKISSGDTTALEIESSDTIGNVKAKIQAKTGIAPMKMKLICAGKLLKDNYIVDDYIFDNNATVYLVLRARPSKMTILIKTPSGDTTPLEIELSDTIGDIKANIQGKERISPEKMKLVRNGEPLEDAYILNDYIKNDATVFLVLRAEPHKMRILIKTLAIPPP